MFQTLFSSDQRGAVAPVVRELWGARHAADPGDGRGGRAADRYLGAAPDRSGP